MPGLDYVAHEDVLPYRTTEHKPISHELFDKFLMPDTDKGMHMMKFILNSFKILFTIHSNVKIRLSKLGKP
jgi:polymerase delta-interacting protein 2